MLAVFKKRWVPKRAAGNINNNNNNNNNKNARRAVKSVVIDPHPTQTEVPQEKLRMSTSPRQVHPVNEKVAMSPVPNICVQGGRIEFIKPNGDKSDPVKEKLEARIAELETQLEEEKQLTLRERRNTARFQALIEDRESLQRDVEFEKEARIQLEGKLQEALTQADSTKSKIHTLQANVNRLEEQLRTTSQYKTKYAQLKLENTSLTNAIEGKMQQFQSTLNKLKAENETLKGQLQTLEATGNNEERLAQRLFVVEEENHRLLKERGECEKCLDQVAHQVVRTLLAQKGLREEISSLKDRVKELEKQNHALSSLLIQQIPSKPLRLNGTTALNLKEACREICMRPLSLDDTHLKWSDPSFVWFPLRRPSSLDLEMCRNIMVAQECSSKGGESHRDEGYSTMSSEVQCDTTNPSSSGPMERLQEETTCNHLADTIPSQKVLDDELIFSLRLLKSGRQSYPPVRLSALLRSSSDSQLIPYGGGEPFCEADWWEPECVQQWLRLDDPRPPLQLRPDFFTNELEEWTMDELPGLQSGLECGGTDFEDLWYSMLDGQYHLISPGADSWSSNATSDEQGESKRSSTMSESDSPPIGTDFTRDFYRLVKFESTKSLASNSSRSQADSASLRGDREQAALQTVLHFISEQEKLVGDRSEAEVGDVSDCLVTVLEEEEESQCQGPEGERPKEGEEEGDKESLISSSSTSKQVIDSLMEIHKNEEELCENEVTGSLDEDCCSTGWVRVRKPIDFNDPKARANLLDVMMSSRSSSSCSGSSESGDDHTDYLHLHRLHRSRRHKKAWATREGVVRCHDTSRVSIIGREDMFTRFGAQEREAVASFDFLEEFSSSSRESTVPRS